MKIYLQASAFIVALSAILTFFTYRYVIESSVTPCTPGGSLIKCYNISQRMCERALASSVGSCKEWLAKFKVPPGRLTGPIIQKCQASALDAAFGVSRKATPECQEMIRDLDGWRRRNQPPN